MADYNNRTKISDLTVGQFRNLMDDIMDGFLDGIDGQVKVERWPAVMTTEQAAEYLKTKGIPGFENKRKMYTLRQSGALVPVKRGGALGYKRGDLDLYAGGVKQKSAKEKADSYLNGK